MVMGFLGFANVYALRVNLGVALVAMVNLPRQPITDALIQNHIGNNSNECTAATEFGKDDTGCGEFNWDSHIQGTILAAFFYGYMMTQVLVFDKTLICYK